jgi:hypothetical protein
MRERGQMERLCVETVATDGNCQLFCVEFLSGFLPVSVYLTAKQSNRNVIEET